MSGQPFRIATRWKIGGGVEAVGARFANTTDTNQVPRYGASTRWSNARKRHYALRLNVLNLFDTRYYAGVTRDTSPGHDAPFAVHDPVQVLRPRRCCVMPCRAGARRRCGGESRRRQASGRSRCTVGAGAENRSARDVNAIRGVVR
jgi:hypothetical protein